MIASAQISVYPLRQERLGPAIATVQATLEASGMAPEVGPMSTRVVGESAAIFAALADAFDKASDAGETVMVITVSNACPIPG